MNYINKIKTTMIIICIFFSLNIFGNTIKYEYKKYNPTTVYNTETTSDSFFYNIKNEYLYLQDYCNDFKETYLSADYQTRFDYMILPKTK